MRPHAEWKVRIHSPRPCGPSRRWSRSRISPAALLVKVIARISFGLAPTAWIRCTTRYVSTRVLPEPAPAMTRSGPSVARTASRWGGLRSARYCSGDATAMRPMLASPAVRLALMIEGQEGVTWDDWVALADACEEHGVESLFRSDHYISGSDETRPVLDAWATIAGLAARTTKLELGTLVSPATFRHPSLLARNAATADEISGGRIVLGMGAGWMEREHEAYGFDFATTRERVARFAEQLEIVHDLLHEPRVDFSGAHYRLHDAPGLGRPDLTILVGGSAKPGTTAPAVRFADEYNCVFGTFDDARERKQRLDEACARGDRDPATLRYSLMAPLVVGRNEREVQQSAQRIGER